MLRQFLSLETFLLSSKYSMDTETSYSMLAFINSTFKADIIGKCSVNLVRKFLWWVVTHLSSISGCPCAVSDVYSCN